MVDTVAEVLTDTPAAFPKDKSKAWGFHLLIDASGCNKKMDDPKEVIQFFEDLVTTLKMKTLSEVITKRVKGKTGSGLSAMQLITTSSLDFHGDDKNMCLYMDVFSCKDFDQSKVLRLIQKTFTPKKMAHKFLYRDAGP